MMFSVYLIIGLAGYFSTYEMTRQIVLERQSLGGNYIDSTFLVAIIGILMLLFVNLPVNYHPWRAQLIYMKYKDEKFS